MAASEPSGTLEMGGRRRLGVYPYALLLIAIVCLLGAAALRLVFESDRATVGSRLESTIRANARLLSLWSTEQRRRTASIAAMDTAVRLARPLLASADPSQPDPKAAARFAEWVAPLVQSDGYLSFVLVTPDYRIVAATEASRIGGVMLTESAAAASAALRDGTAVSAPYPGSYRTVEPSGKAIDLPFQLACARVSDAGRATGVLCLRIDPRAVLLQILEAGRFGRTGELYGVDAQGRLTSPSRFEAQLVAQGKLAPNTSSMLNIWAQPAQPAFGGNRTIPAESDLTELASAVVRSHALTLASNYRDYRGEPVVGAGLWLPSLEMGLIVEQDVDEAFSTFRFTRDVLVALTTAIVVLIAMVAWLLRRAEQRLAQSQERLRAILEYSPAFMHLKDRRHTMLELNPAMQMLLGRRIEDVLGKSDAEFAETPDGTGERWKVEERVMTTGEAEEHVYAMQTQRGERHLHVMRFPVRDPETGEVAGVGAVGIDITEQVEASGRLKELSLTLEQKVEERTRELAQANVELAAAKQAADSAAHAKASFLANMSHEIRTPMNAVIGMAHLALRTRLDAKQRSYLEKIQHSGQHLLEIIDDVLDLSRIEAGKMDIERVDFSLERLLRTVSDLVSQQAATKELELIVEVLPDVPDSLCGDPLRIRQVLINFTNNAVKFTDRGEIVIRVERHDAVDAQPRIRLRFEVRDTGIGIAAEDRARLFQSFEQADATMTRRYGGSGLGLAICQRLVRLMGGTIGVESRVGEGSTFWFSLDLLPGKKRPPLRPLAPELQNCRVLVTDDHAYARQVIATMLRGFGFRVDEADCGESALACVALADEVSDPYRMVFLDWSMPGLDGIETARRLDVMRLRNPTPRRVMITAHGREDVLLEGEKAGFDATLIKPVSPSVLLDATVRTLAADGGHPVYDDEQQTPGDDVAPLPAARVLLVEDNEINRELAVNLLQAAGIDPDTAENGAVALRMLDRRVYDLVLMDVQMPVMDGFEATRLIRANPRLESLPVLAMTANALPEDRARCLAAGMGDHIAKPISPDAFYATLRHWLSSVAAARASGPASSGHGQAWLDALAAAAELDVGAGLARVAGRPAVYRQLLERFASGYADAADQIGMLIEADDHAGARGVAHSLKGVAGNLGATRVYATAAAVEAALLNQHEPADRVADEAIPLDALRAALVPVLAALSVHLPAVAPPPAHETRDGTGSRGQTLSQILATLRRQLEDGEAEAAETLLLHRAALAGALSDEDLDRLHAQIERYDYGSAMSTLEAVPNA